MIETEITYKRVVETKDYLVKWREDDIIHVTLKSFVILDIPTQLKLVEEYKKFSTTQKFAFVFDAEEGVIITPEARDNAKKISLEYPVIATAAIADTLPYKLIANFYLKINKPIHPFKVFTKMDLALEWLR